MKNYLTFIILSLLSFGCFFKRKLVYVYPKDSSMMEVVFHPENFDDWINYTFLGYYDTISSMYTMQCKFTDDSTLNKVLIFEHEKKQVTQEVSKNKVLLSKGRYYLNDSVVYGYEPIYNEFADETDSVMVVP